MRRIRTGITLSLALAAVASGCRHDDVYVPRARTPGVDEEPSGPPVKAWFSFPALDGGVSGTGAADLAEFCAQLSSVPKSGSVGFLPLVMYDSDHGGPWVPELGAALADEAAAGLRAKGFGGAVLDTADMGIRLSQVNLQKVT